MFLAEGSNAGFKSAIRSTANYRRSCSRLLSKRQSWTQPSLRFKPAQKPVSTATEKSSSAPLMPSTQSGQDKRSRTRPVLETVKKSFIRPAKTEGVKKFNIVSPCSACAVAREEFL